MRHTLSSQLRRHLISLRQQAGPTHTNVRFASSSSSSSAEAAQQKAKDALESAQKSAGRLLEGVGNFLEPLGKRAGSLLGGYREPLLYNLAVAREIVKQVYRAESLQPPSLDAIQQAYKTLWARASDPVYLREIVGNGEITRVGVYALEAYGIFKIGEIFGRRSLVGYDLH